MANITIHRSASFPSLRRILLPVSIKENTLATLVGECAQNAKGLTTFFLQKLGLDAK